MLLADALANFARLALRAAVGLLFFHARQFEMASASGQRGRDRERLLVMPAAWKARVRAVYGRVCEARPPQLRNYGVITSWRHGIDWARAVLGLGRDFTQAATTTARAELAAFDDGILRAGPGGTKDLRLKQDTASPYPPPSMSPPAHSHTAQ